jgi:SAM-dependent methyltransferase
MTTNSATASFYAFEGLRSRLDRALEASGLTNAPIDWRRLAMADQFHAGGIEATREAVSTLDLTAESEVLDLGSGFGGPARLLAGTYGCRVIGIDLTPEYVEIATDLTERTGLSDLVSFKVADALELPFPDHRFDAALTQHVGMNISDKRRFYSEIFRVLKPGGRVAIYDVVLTGDESLTYPMPWASTDSASHVVRPEEIVRNLQEAGFDEIQTEDKTPLALRVFAEMGQLMETPGGPPPLNLISLLGGNSIVAVRNLAEALSGGRLEARLFTAQKSSGSQSKETIHAS